MWTNTLSVHAEDYFVPLAPTRYIIHTIDMIVDGTVIHATADEGGVISIDVLCITKDTIIYARADMADLYHFRRCKLIEF